MKLRLCVCVWSLHRMYRYVLETLRKSLIAVLVGKLYERGKYQPQIQFPEGEVIYNIWEAKIIDLVFIALSRMTRMKIIVD